LAFVHIEKAAGTTLIHVLRRNYLFRYLDVRPLDRRSGGIFRPSDLRASLRINPFLRCIGGHAVVPYAGLERVRPDIRYITVLRDPVQRYISQYRYWRSHLGKEVSFEEYLDLDTPRDLQTKKICGGADAESAKAMLKERFYMVGIVEKLDLFLRSLARKLEPDHFNPYYETRNVTRSTKKDSEWGQAVDRIRANNENDIELYRFVVEELIPAQCRELGLGPEAADAPVGFAGALGPADRVRAYLDWLQRKFYYIPVTSIWRMTHGLTGRGSY
jgi:hypothetical protein